MQSLITSYIRTYMPIVVGGLVSWLVTLGVELDAETQAGLIVALTGLSQAAYYFIARQLERKWPVVGKVLLGSSKQPTYREVK